jgi:hypothetical protein
VDAFSIRPCTHSPTNHNPRASVAEKVAGLKLDELEEVRLPLFRGAGCVPMLEIAAYSIYRSGSVSIQ